MIRICELIRMTRMIIKKHVPVFNSSEHSDRVRGFTLIELLLVISIIAILGVVTGSIGANFLAGNNLENKVNELTSSFRIAQMNVISGKEDSNWGVTVVADEIILFAGDSYETRDAAFDQTFSIPASISISAFEVVFSKPQGNPSSTQTITLESPSDSASISINEVGIVDVN